MLMPEPYQPNFFPARETIDPSLMYVGLPVYGWVLLTVAVSDPKYLEHLGPLMEVIQGSELLQRLDAATAMSNKGAVKLALEAIEHDFDDADIVGVLVNTVCVPHRVEVTIRYADGTKTTYRQNPDDEAAESWSKVCNYDLNGERLH